MKTSFKKLNATLLVTTLALSSILNGPALAAVQGTLGATSTGSADINVRKSALVRISNLSDMSLDAYTLGDGDKRLFTEACIYSSTRGGKYKITATGSGTDSAFTITDGTDVIPYAVVWNSAGAGSLGTTGATLTKAVQSGTLQNASTTSTSCAGGNTAQLNLNFLQADLDAAPAGLYSGTITMVVAPV